jgi:glycosyltransferase involved in cell wall biosynthesis
MDRGGLERVVCDLACEQARAGHLVRIVCLFRDGLLAGEAVNAAVPVAVVGKKAGFDVAAMLRLRRLICSGNPGIVHTHNATAHYHAALATAGCTGMTLINSRHGMGGSLASDRREKLFSIAMRRTAAVVAVCEAAAKRLADDGIVPARLIRVVPNGIRLESFRRGGRSDARRRLGVPEDALVVGTVGRLNWAKDHEFLLQAFKRMLRDEPGAFLVIVGDGELKAALTRRSLEPGLSGRVKLAGDRSDVDVLLPGFDIFALSSCTEGYSVALLEASAAGIPIVATDVGGNREIVVQGATGLLAAHGDVDGFGKALAELAGSPALRENLGRGARAWATANGSLESMKSRYDQLYAEFLPAAVPGRDSAASPAGPR